MESTMKSERRIWLNAEHDIAYFATIDEVHLLLEYLEAPHEWRQRTAAQLRRQLESDDSLVSHSVPCPRPLGSFVVLPGRLAAWLLTALEQPAEEVENLRDKLANWLAGENQTTCRATKSVGMNERSNDQSRRAGCADQP
jgi:hypothetical protein